MKDLERKGTYESEAVFIDTEMWVKPGFDKLKEETEAILSSPNWMGCFGTINLSIEQLGDRVTTKSGLFRARNNMVMYASNAVRLVVPHELAHAAQYNAGHCGTPHGAEFRGWFVTTLRWGYGSEASEMLARSYRSMGLDIVLPKIDTEISVPAIMIDDRPKRVWM